MKEVLELIEQRKKEFAKLPFFEYLADESIDPRERLVWVPCIVPLVMSVKDWNNCILRQEPTEDPIQKMINFHSYEDGRHWKWFLSDLQKMGLDSSLKFTDSVQFLWGEETQAARLLGYNLIASTLNADPVMKLVAVEAIEATGNIGFAIFAEIGEQLQRLTKQSYRYFSKSHFILESGHLVGDIDNIEDFLQQIILTNDQRLQAFKLVELIFSNFTSLLNEMMLYTQNKLLTKPLIATTCILN